MSESGSTFVIDGEFSIYRAAELAQQLQAWLPRAVMHGRIQLHLGDVTEMDSAGLQLLLALDRSAQQQQQQLHIVAASPAVQQVLQLTAMESLLNHSGTA